MTINLTDSANHPANGPLTAERIERVRDELQRSIQYQNGGDMAYVIADAIKGLEELLVEKEAASKPVGNEELDQMIWKLERDGGMTPKLLSLMRELRERRRADKPTDDERIMTIEGIAPPVTQIKAVADLYGITSPTGSETSFTFYAAEASDFAKAGWSVQEYVELERYQAAVAANYRETVNSSTNNFRENAETSTNSFTDAELEMMANGNNPVANAYRELLEFRRNSPVTPDVWIPVSVRMPDPKSEARVCVYTPTPHEDLRYRFVPASLFKTVCRDASHWRYMTAPSSPKEVKSER